MLSDPVALFWLSIMRKWLRNFCSYMFQVFCSLILTIEEQMEAVEMLKRAVLKGWYNNLVVILRKWLSYFCSYMFHVFPI